MKKPGKHNSRRFFMKTVGASVSFPYFVSSEALGAGDLTAPEDRVVTAHIGVGGRGRGHLWHMLRWQNRGSVRVAAVCDVDENRLGKAYKKTGGKATPYRDYRYILERNDIDAVVISTPDHWHAVQTVHAAECGKHIYVEKPACCTIEEGKRMVSAAEKSGVAVQVGSQGRSQPEAYLAHRYIVNKLGKVSRVRCWHYPSPQGGYAPDCDPPPQLDWDMWLGPLRWRPYNPGYCHGTFRWLMESGGGEIRDRGAHVMSCAKYWLGADGTGPVSVEATGTVPGRGLWDSAVHMEVKYTFKNPDWILTWSQPGEPVPKEKRKPGERKITRPGYGAVYYGEDEQLVVWGGDGGTWAERKAREWELPPDGKDVYNSPGHMEDWFKGIRTGAETIMNVKAGVGVANLCVLGNLAFTLGRKLNWDPVKKEIVGDEQARRMMGRPERHPYHM